MQKALLLHSKMMDLIAPLVGKANDPVFKSILWRPSSLRDMISTPPVSMQIAMMLTSPLYADGNFVVLQLDADGKPITAEQYESEFGLNKIKEKDDRICDIIANYNEQFRELAKEHQTTAGEIYKEINRRAVENMARTHCKTLVSLVLIDIYHFRLRCLPSLLLFLLAFFHCGMDFSRLACCLRLWKSTISFTTAFRSLHLACTSGSWK